MGLSVLNKINTVGQLVTALDKSGQKVLLEILPELAKESLVFIVSHRDTFDKIATKIISLG